MSTLSPQQPLVRSAVIRRSVVFMTLILLVVILHGCVGLFVDAGLADLQSDAEVPARTQVVYQAQLIPSAPPPAARPAAPRSPAPRQPPRRIVKPAPPEPTATSPEVVPEMSPELSAQAPEPVQLEPQAEPSDEPESPSAATPETPPAEVTPPAAPPPAPAFEWPRSTRLSYVLRGNYRGELNGSAQVEWIRRDDRYQVYMDVACGLIFERHMSSEGRLTADGLSPQQYHEKNKLLFKKPKASSMVVDDRGVVLPSGQILEAPTAVQDPASQFIQLTYLFLTQPERLHAGAQIPMTLATPRNVTDWVYDVLPIETLETPVGQLKAYPLKPRRLTPGRPNDVKADVWFSPELQYLPVRIRLFQDENNYLDLFIAKNPEVGN